MWDIFCSTIANQIRALPKRKEHVLRRKNIDNLRGS